MDNPLLSPTTISAWLDCSWYLTVKLGDNQAERNHPGPFADLLMRKGLDHERACLEEFERQGRTVFRTPEWADGETFAQWTSRVGNPMERGWDVIYQYPMIHDGLRGVADFLVRVPDPVAGHSFYEPYDAKLARLDAKPGHVLQLCFYAEAIEALTGAPPKHMHLWLGSGRIESLEVEQFGAYWRRLRRRLSVAVANPEGGAVRPEQCSYCEFCEFSQQCEDTWRASDSLVYVAGSRKKERAALESAGVDTLTELATFDGQATGIPPSRQDRLRRQADLQVVSRLHQENPPAFRSVPPGDDPVWGHGYAHLPEPDPGDVYFDLEGHPFWTPNSGLFFLFGLWYQQDGEWTYDARWAHDLDAESAVAAELVEFFYHRRQGHPGVHVYHYNHTERSSLTSMTLGRPSEALFAHLRDTGLFVDLMAVVTNAFQVGVESYGLKSLEALAGYERHGEIEGGSGAVVDYDLYMETHDLGLLDAIAQYNEDDVRATQALHRWLLGQRPADLEWRAAVMEGFDGDPELDQLAGQLLGFDQGTVEHLLGDLLGYWRRETSAEFGPKFAHLQADSHELVDARNVLADLSFVEFEAHEGRTPGLVDAVFSWPDQPVADGLRSGSVLVAGGPGQSGFATLVSVDRDQQTVTLRWTAEWEQAGFMPRALVASEWVDPEPKPTVLGGVARQVLGLPGAGSPRPVTLSLLERALPRFLPNAGPADDQFHHDDLDSILSWVGDLDSSFVAIQGPPGTGKTYRGAHIVHALVTSGKRVGISAFGHTAIDNLLEAVHAVFEEKGELPGLAVSKKYSNKSQKGTLDRVKYTTSNKAAANLKYDVVTGTPWFFASSEMQAAPVDVLIIDESGQLALADAVVSTVSAHNVILLGDPLQLTQVSKATHPNGAGASVLQHVLGDETTIAPDRGVFLAESRRLHPAICEFISTQFYEGRLTSHAGCSNQRIDGVEPGLVWIEAHHEGRSTSSPEEAELLSETIVGLLGREWTDTDGDCRQLDVEDFMVVAPYNDQVHLVRAVLEQDGRTAGVRVGTVDKFQGGEAPVVLFSMATSTGDDMPRGPEFLFSRNRLNVAISRAQYLTGLVCNEALLDSRARNVDEMLLIGTLGAFVEAAHSLVLD